MATWILNQIFLITFIVISLSYLSVVDANVSKNHGSPCSKRKECNPSAGLTCLKGICQCSNPEILTFSEKLETCVIKVGRRCGADDEADEVRASNTADNSTGVCVANAECRKLKLRKWCRCKEGFMSNGDGTQCAPVARYGEICNDETDLCEKRSGTECIQGSCQCPFGEQQYFDLNERKCVSYANGNCSVPNVSPCVKNSVCVNVQLRTGYTTELGVKKIHTKSVTQCHCVKGYSDHKTGYCMAAAGTECNAKQICNSEAYLTCVDGKCKCRNPLHEMVDENTGKCVSLVGSSCQVEGGLGCVENAECIDGQCQCNDGYSVTPKKTCLLSYKQICEPHQCNMNGGLACINGLCECFDSHLVYENSAKACVGLSSSSD